MSAPLPDIVEVLPHLPHRYPLPLVDRLLTCAHGKAAGLKNVTMNEPFFEGHFPGYPVMPGVLVIEALIQLCALLAVHDGRLALDGTMRLVFPGIDACRFKRQVVPGDSLMLEASVEPDPAHARFRVRASVDGETAAEALIVARFEDAAPAQG